jgi:branched-chain amino acid transport system permease protein
MTQVVVSVVSGLQQGSALVLIALGLVLAFRATETFSFAHGQMMVLPAFIIGMLQADGHSLAVAILIALGVAVGSAVVFQLLVLQKTLNQPIFVGTIATLGYAAILSGVLGVAFPGDKNYVIDVPGMPETVFSLFGARIRLSSLLVAIFAIALALGVAALLRWTHLGIKLTAVGQDALVASQAGIRVRRLHAFTWALVALLAAAAGVAQGVTTGVGLSSVNLGLLAFPALILGGLTSVGGTMIAGLGIGIMQGFVASYLGGDKVDVITYVLLLAVIMWRPSGFFGIRTVSRA